MRFGVLSNPKHPMKNAMTGQMNLPLTGMWHPQHFTSSCLALLGIAVIIPVVLSSILPSQDPDSQSPFAGWRLLCSWEHPRGCGAGWEVWDLPSSSSQGSTQCRGLARAPFEEMENPIICSFFSQCEASEHSAAVECGLLLQPGAASAPTHAGSSGSPGMGITFPSPDPCISHPLIPAFPIP